jgi:hypothetical protein
MTESGYGRDPRSEPPAAEDWQVGAMPTPGDVWQQGTVSGPADRLPYGMLPLQRPRPRRATTVSVLLIVFGALGLLIGVLLLALISHDKNKGETISTALYISAYLQLLLSAAEIAGGVLVLQGKEWARILAIVLCSLNVLGGVISLVSGGGGSGIVGMGLNLLMIRLLLNSEVAEWTRRA